MRFFFNNPASLGLFKTMKPENDDLRLEAVYVNPNPHKRNYDYEYNTLSANSNYRISDHICRMLNISLSRIDWKEFVKLKCIFAESLLIHEHNLSNNDLMLYAGDAYCIFGFSGSKKFFRTKYKLEKHWEKKISPRNQSNLYLFNKYDKKIKYSNISFLDIEKSSYYLNFAIRDLLPVLLNECGLNLNQRYLLVLPYPNFTDNDYVTSFNSRVLEVAEKENLQILLKPHKKDRLDYSQVFGERQVHSIDMDLLKLIPVEFFFYIDNVKKIVASPSTSLVFADNSKLEILAPNNSVLYRKFFLDLEPYLGLIGKAYKKV